MAKRDPRPLFRVMILDKDMNKKPVYRRATSKAEAIKIVESQGHIICSECNA